MVLNVNYNRGLPVPKCTDGIVSFGKVGRRVVQAAFDGGDIVSDGGVMLVREVDRRLGLTKAASKAFPDSRRAASVQHSVHDMVAQRVYAMCRGWEDVSDHNELRGDVVLQTAVGRAEGLASGPRSAAWRRRQRRRWPVHSTRCWWTPSLPPRPSRPGKWCWTLTRPMCRCTARRSGRTSTTTTTTTATCRCTCLRDRICWHACCGPATANPPRCSVP